MTNFEKVRNFRLIFRRAMPRKPRLLSSKEHLHNIALIGEEFMEFVEANTIEEAAKELGDILYVTYGTLAQMGIDADKVFAAIHESNMTKLGPNGKPLLRPDGKILKGPSYREPDIQGALA